MKKKKGMHSIGQLIADFKLDDKEGVIVGNVFEDSPAQKGGIKSGDIIISFAGKPVTNVRTLLKLVGTADVGKKERVVVLRDGKKKTLDIKVGERPADLTKIASSGAKEEKGWKYGEIKDEKAKTHHCMVPFSELPVEQQAKDFIFRAVVHALS